MKNTLYRKLLYVISMVLLSLVAVLLFRPEEGIFRMHVIANSDSAADQATKLAVRDAILDYERGMGNVGSAEEVKARLMDYGRGICTAAAIPATIIRRDFRIFSRFLRLTIRNAAPSRQITPSMRNCAFSKPITAVVNMLSRARKSMAVKNAAKAIFVPRLSGKG